MKGSNWMPNCVFLSFMESQGGFSWVFLLQEVKLTQTLENDLNHSFGF